LENVEMIDALPYHSFEHLMNGAYILLTDSGGIQEEAAALHKPVLVMRDVTERSEGIAIGTAELVGRKASDIVSAYVIWSMIRRSIARAVEGSTPTATEKLPNGSCVA
jgi:UDP-N-acetylglucosamine 2-epimerase